MRISVFGVLCILLLVADVRAEEVYSNFGPGDSYNSTIYYGLFKSGSSQTNYGMRFTTPSGPHHLLDSIEIPLGTYNFNAFPSPGAQVWVDVYTSTGGASPVPDRRIARDQLAGVANSGNYSPRIYTAEYGGVTWLDRNTEYWVVASLDNTDGTLQWSRNTTGAVDYAVDFFGTGWSSRMGFEQSAFRVNGTPVPEPGTWALMGLGGLGLWFAHRRRRSRTA